MLWHMNEEMRQFNSWAIDDFIGAVHLWMFAVYHTDGYQGDATSKCGDTNNMATLCGAHLIIVVVALQANMEKKASLSLSLTIAANAMQHATQMRHKKKNRFAFENAHHRRVVSPREAIIETLLSGMGHTVWSRANKFNDCMTWRWCRASVSERDAGKVSTTHQTIRSISVASIAFAITAYTSGIYGRAFMWCQGKR